MQSIITHVKTAAWLHVKQGEELNEKAEEVPQRKPPLQTLGIFHRKLALQTEKLSRCRSGVGTRILSKGQWQVQ